MTSCKIVFLSVTEEISKSNEFSNWGSRLCRMYLRRVRIAVTLERKQPSSEQPCRAISVYTVLKELPPLCTELNTYYIFNRCLKDASSRKTKKLSWTRNPDRVLLVAKEEDSSISLLCCCKLLQTWQQDRFKKVQLTCLFYLRLLVTNSEMSEGILKINLICAVSNVWWQHEMIFHFFIFK